MGSVFLLMGSNLGDRFSHLLEARQHISRQVGKIVTVSSIYRTDAWGNHDQPDFFNQAVEIEPLQGPHPTLLTLLQIEKEMGRVRVEKYGSRIIDLDILIWKDAVVRQPDLIIPHPHMQHRRFALEPLVEIAAQGVHPVLRKTFSQLLEACTDELTVNRVEL
jgi:2-amino-4-hydroxy-6-hydroxymethyldihydropteridine diphosphokinase